MTALAGVLVCFLPLVNLLGYESAAVFGVIGGLTATFLTLHAVTSGIVNASLDQGRETSPTADFFVLLVRHELLLAVPALLLSLNALRVVNCAWDTGVGFWLAIAMPSIFLGQAIGWLATALLPGRNRLQIGFCVLVILTSAATLLAHLALQPPIVGHQLFLGYFSGSIYDEALALPSSLLWYRAMNLAGAIVVLGIIEVLWRRRQERPSRWVAIWVLVGLAGFGAIWLSRHDLGIRIDREYIQEELGGRMETEHFVIHYPQTERFLKNKAQLAEDHEFRYAELAKFFDTEPAAAGKIHSYVYPGREEKGRLMGGRRTLVAKLWLHEMHITWRGYGDHKLAHELAHIFTEPFGAGPLALSMQAGVGVNMGLVEGAAAAADWPTEELSPHQASAALRRLELAPGISYIVDASGFWTQSSGRAYTLVGSFVRFLIDTYGVEKFKAAYPTGDFAAAYGKPASELVAEWEAFVDDIELSEHEMELARFLFDRPTIFDKVCAREIGELERQAGLAASEGNVGLVTETYEQIIGYAPRNINHRIAYAHALTQAHEYDRALELVEELLDGDHAPAVRARLLHLRGDLAWRRGNPELAEEAYRDCLALGVPSDIRRLLEVKIDALGRAPGAGREQAFEYLLGDTSAGVSLYYPMHWHHEHSDDALAAYLVGRRLWAEQVWERAMPYLEQANDGLDDGVLRQEALRMLGITAYFLDRLAQAEASFEKLRSSEHPAYRASAREWLARIAWKRGNRIGTQ